MVFASRCGTDRLLLLWELLADTNKGGFQSVNMMQLVLLMRLNIGDDLQSKLKFLFDLFDINKSNMLTSSELRSMLSAFVGLVERMGDASKRRMSSDEMAIVIKNVYLAADGDGSGYITSFEFTMWAQG